MLTTLRIKPKSLHNLYIRRYITPSATSPNKSETRNLAFAPSICKPVSTIVRNNPSILNCRFTSKTTTDVVTGDTMSRPLGGLEQYLYDWNILCDDTYMMLVSVTCKLPITTTNISTAVAALVEQHPLLRMSIENTGSRIRLIESGHTTIPLQFMSREKLLDHFQSCSLYNRMWELNVLKQNQNVSNVFDLTFMFAMHPILSDYVYTRQAIVNLFQNLYHAQVGRPILYDARNTCSWTETIETVTDQFVTRRTSPVIDMMHCDNGEILTSNEAFRRLGEQRNETTTTISSRAIRWKFDQHLSKAFESSSLCKSSINATLVAVYLKSFMNIIKITLKQNERVEIPFTFMANLRRYLNKNVSFHGNGSIETMCFIRMRSHDHINDIAAAIAEKIQELAKSGEILRRVREDLNSEISRTMYIREVIAMTHIGHIDNLLGTDNNFCLRDVQFSVNASSELCPLFNILTYFLGGELHFCVSYCSMSLREETAESFVNSIEDIIKNHCIS